MMFVVAVASYTNRKSLFFFLPRCLLNFFEDEEKFLKTNIESMLRIIESKSNSSSLLNIYFDVIICILKEIRSMPALKINKIC